MTNYLGLLAEAEALDHDVTEAQATIERALEVNPLQRAWWIEALTIRAELRVADGKPDLGEADFREAMDRAGEIGAKAFELRAAVGLARLIYGRDRKAASVLLAQIYATFSEGFDTADIKDAKALLDELNGKPSTLIRLPDSTNNNNV